MKKQTWERIKLTPEQAMSLIETEEVTGAGVRGLRAVVRQLAVGDEDLRPLTAIISHTVTSILTASFDFDMGAVADLLEESLEEEEHENPLLDPEPAPFADEVLLKMAREVYGEDVDARVTTHDGVRGVLIRHPHQGGLN